MGPEPEDEDERAESGTTRDAEARTDRQTESADARTGERDRGADDGFVEGPGLLAEDPPPN